MVMQSGGIEWRVSGTPVDYAAAVEEMERRVASIRAGAAAELVWLLEHPPLYTAGTSARDEELIEPGRLPVHRTGRGGRYTYHGPGQRIAYVMLDLRRRGQDVRCYVHQLEEWIIRTLARFAVRAERREDGARTFRLIEAEPQPTSYGEDSFRRVFGMPVGAQSSAL